jgi:hypothetical protein
MYIKLKGKISHKSDYNGRGVMSMGSNTIDKKKLAHQDQVHPFESLAKQGRWEEVENVLNCCNADFDYAAPVGDTFSHGDPILHMVCRNHPPVSIVQRLLHERSPALAMREVNQAGQTPLHVAAASGASFRVVHYLVEQCDDPDMVAAQDLEGNTPLHLHFSHTCGEKVRDPGFLSPPHGSTTVPVLVFAKKRLSHQAVTVDQMCLVSWLLPSPNFGGRSFR